MGALADVNVLVALMHARHVHPAPASGCQQAHQPRAASVRAGCTRLMDGA